MIWRCLDDHSAFAFIISLFVEQRQILLVLAQSLPEGGAAIEFERLERSRLGQPCDRRAAKPRAAGEIVDRGERPLPPRLDDPLDVGRRNAGKNVEAEAEGEGEGVVDGGSGW